MKFSKCLLILIPFAVVSAQNKNETLNLFGSIGWGFGTGGSLFSSVNTDYSNSTDVKRNDSYLNYGRGFKFDLGAQYFMMNNVALQMGIGFSAGVPGLKTEDHNLKVPSTETVFQDSTTNYKFGLFGIKALVVPRFEILDLLNMYAGVGFGLFWSSMKYEVTKVSSSGTQNESGKIKASPTLALLGELGADYPISDIISLYGEIALEQMSFTWKEKVIEKTNIDGHTPNGTEIYEKDVTNQGAPLNSPGSNWQIRFGVRFMVF
jgi:hypothetical protein